MTETKEYTVDWSVDVNAQSYQHAAALAREMQLDPSTLATVFHVRDNADEQAEVKRIELPVGKEVPIGYVVLGPNIWGRGRTLSEAAETCAKMGRRSDRAVAYIVIGDDKPTVHEVFIRSKGRVVKLGIATIGAFIRCKDKD